jgi:hypothetical protein
MIFKEKFHFKKEYKDNKIKIQAQQKHQERIKANKERICINFN